MLTEFTQMQAPSVRRTIETEGEALPYVKGEGCGNTFLIFDYLDLSDEMSEGVMKEAHSILIKENRDDALILKREYQNEQKLVLTMIVLEPDQSIAEFCGNGARVVSRYLQYKFGNQKLEYFLKTSRGMRKIWWEENIFFVDMGKTKLSSNKGKFYRPNFETLNLGLGMRKFNFYWTETLEPHLVTFDEMHEKELLALGLYLNSYQRDFFPLGINLNKAEVLSEDSLRVITFERGVNRITAACGTGATSCAMLARAIGRIKANHRINVYLKAGSLTIHPKKESSVMSGPASVEIL